MSLWFNCESLGTSRTEIRVNKKIPATAVKSFFGPLTVFSGKQIRNYISLAKKKLTSGKELYGIQ